MTSVRRKVGFGLFIMFWIGYAMGCVGLFVWAGKNLLDERGF